MEFSTDAARRQEPTRHDLKHGTIYEARAEDVYPLLTPGSVSLIHSDGPYAVGKADWDRMKVSDLAAWYRPHIEAWGRLCAPSASIYHWGTAEGWATVHSEYLRQGWTFRTLVIWDKGGATLGGIAGGVKDWPEATEICGIYGRGVYHHNHQQGDTNVWKLHWNTYSDEKIRTGVMSSRSSKISGDSMVDGTLHPCQKPLKFADRIIRASSRPGDLILEPFGGTCRIAVACEQIARYKPADARRYVCVEMNADGVDYIGPVIKQIEQNARQVTLFEGLGR